MQEKVSASAGILERADPREWRSHRYGLPAARWQTLAGRTFWITGAGTGYGRCIAVALGCAGAEVFLTGRRAEKLRETVTEAADYGADPQRFIPVPADLTDPARLDAAVLEVTGRCRSIYGLVNNAALPGSKSTRWPLTDASLERWGRMLATNVTAHWHLSALLLPQVAEHGEGRVLFMSSEAGWAFTPGYGIYNVTKAALNSLACNLAAEAEARWPEADIQINVLVPGEARTEMNQGLSVSPYSVVSMALALLSHPRGGPTGRLFHRDGRHLAFAYATPYEKSLLDGSASIATAQPRQEFSLLRSAARTILRRFRP